MENLDICPPWCDNNEVKKYRYGLVAQLGAHHIRIVGVVGSNPIRSTEKTPFPLRDGVFYMERVPPPPQFSTSLHSPALIYIFAQMHIFVM